MLNVIDLENKWTRYKIKSYIPYGIIALSIVVIITLSSMLLFKEPAQKSQPTQEVSQIKQKEVQPATAPKAKEYKIAQAQPAVEQSTVVKNNKDSKMILKPSLSFIKEMQTNTLAYYTEDTPKEVKKTHHIKRQTIKNIPTPKTQVIKREPEPVLVKKHSISISKEDPQKSLNDVIKRFKTNNNPALSLFVAKKYYDLKEYQKSYNYALMTNEINSNIEASWIIFAKSLVKLGEREKAIKTLQAYVSQSHSNNAKILLDDIRSGKFK